MNHLQLHYFEALTRDRSENADILEKASMRGVKNSVVEKYSDQAHFVYELLQNANDARATNARFILEEERLIFAHDGSRQFSVSDPAREEEDSLYGRLGDINAITSIGNSNKTEASIGKFGVGFKAVFQYSSAPSIYDPVFHFQIERFIVPRLLESDFQGRLPNETLFVFPFDNPNKAYSDILNKLQNLIYPVLFLDKLEKITVTCGDFHTEYSRRVLEKTRLGTTLAQKIQLTQPTGIERLWLFTRETDKAQYKLPYSVGYFLDDEGKLRPVSLPAFCFFPTREATGLNFIVHAPFLLTDSREGIRAGDEHNINMIELLSKLAGDSMLYLRDIGANTTPRLIDDNILEIIPINRSIYAEQNDAQKLSFLPFYERIAYKFRNERLLPAKDCYVYKQDAYWAAFPSLPKLFSDTQLAEICGNANAHWVFRSLGREQISYKYKDFVTSLVRTFINEDVIIKGRNQDYYYDFEAKCRRFIEPIKGIPSDFVERQSIEWLHQFYKWLSDTRHRTLAAKHQSIFLDSAGKAAAAYDEHDHLTIFLPTQEMEGYRVVHPALLEDSTTKEFILKIGITEPERKDYIYNVFLPRALRKNTPIEDKHFVTLFSYWYESNSEARRSLIRVIKDRCYLKCVVNNSLQTNGEKAGDLYMPTPLMLQYFSGSNSVAFLPLDSYLSLVEYGQEESLQLFFRELGIRENAPLYTVEISEAEAEQRKLPKPYSKRGRVWSETLLHGCADAVDYIRQNKCVEKSYALWQVLMETIAKNGNLSDCFQGTCKFFYRNNQTETFASADSERLLLSAWLVDNTGALKSPKQVTRGQLAQGYDISSEYAKLLLNFLQIPEDVDYNLSDEQRAKIEFADKLSRLGFSESDIEAFKEFKRLKEAKQNPPNKVPNQPQPRERIAPQMDSPQSPKSTQTEQTKQRASTRERVVNEIVQRTERVREEQREPRKQESRIEPPAIDRDEYIPASVDFAKQIDKAKQKSAEEIEKITILEELHSRALNAGKYTYDWFSALLDIEGFDSGEESLSSREVSISFAKAEREQGTKRTLVLKHPNRYIPHFMEELADIPIILHFGTQTKTVVMEVANIVSYSLRVKLKRDSDIEGIDFSTLTEATIEAKSPAFLLQELRKGFAALNYSPEYNMQQNLSPDIEFIFGPPGTGKTTYLARNVLIPLMSQTRRCRILVLTPTNKAADVLTSRIMESCGNKEYERWLVRFGATADEKIERSPVYKDKSFDIRDLPQNVTITTIARFPYDSFMPQGERLYLNALNWDYIVIDEASMIPLASIVYPLYKKQPKKFIIAGDPFQIEPITTVDLWKNESIYTMVGLDSFSNPRTTPHNYRVELLTTQYRSIPEIGEVFSQFAYDGILKHHRSSYSRRTTGFDDIAPLNIIKFPVSRYESIYRSKRLKHSSSYQIYSALFTFEYVCHLARKIKSNGEPFKIGIIAPYRAQADLIDKLLSSEVLPSHIEVYVGTIHGFQGDECDMIFAVFNTPPSISASNEMFLNKRNIINVSISRARDYLYIVMPDDETEGIENLRLIRKVEQIIKRSESWSEFHSPNLEEEMFNDKRWLENNSFSTSHQSVNVYGLPEKRYEVRSEDAAVDIQIHRAVERPKLATEEKTYNRTTNVIYTPRVSGSLLGTETLAQPSNSLTLRQQQALSVLKRLMQTEPTGVTLKTLAQHIQVSPPGTSLIVNALEEMGLLERVNNPNDRRSIFLKLTDKGLVWCSENI